MIKKLLENHFNLIGFSQNPAITFINRQTYPCKIKNRGKKYKLNQIMEDSIIPGGTLLLFTRCCIILSICSGSIMNATMRISDPHFLQIREFIL